MKKIDPFGRKWEKEANNLARDYCPPIYPCKKCGHPHISIYRCTFCGAANPDSEDYGE